MTQDAERPVHGHGQPAEPDLRRLALANPTIDKWFDASCFVAPTDTTGDLRQRRAAASCAGPGQFNIDASLIKNTRFGHVNTEFRIEAFNLLNHPQFANPEQHRHRSGTRRSAHLAQMLSNPSCSLCGTIERQVQIGLKMRF